MESVGKKSALMPSSLGARLSAWLGGVAGYALLAVLMACAASLVTWNIADPSLTHATSGPTRNALGPVGAIFSDLVMQLLGVAGVCVILPPVFWSLELIGKGKLDGARSKLVLAPIAVVLLACAASSLPKVSGWPLPYGLGGALGDFTLRFVTSLLAMIGPERASAAAGLLCFAGGIVLFVASLGLSQRDLKLILKMPRVGTFALLNRAWRRLGEMSEQKADVGRREPMLEAPLPPPHMSAPAYAPAAVPASGPAPRTYAPPLPRRPQLNPGPDIYDVEDDIDPNELERIVGICAPNTSARAPRPAEDQAILRALEPRPAPAVNDPIHAARQVMVAPAEPQWQSPDLSRTPSHFAEHHQPADYAPEIRAPRPAMVPPGPGGWRPQNMPGGDDLYGRAVAIVLGDRKATAAYLQCRLAIGYMRAADLIERMEREGIVGAPVYNGMRPILIGGPGSSEV
jgi:S-DNA-T family DNA segregation ATPase FtsK/SpoIIIE